LAGEVTEFKAEMTAFKDEMAVFKVEMQEFKEEMRADRREMNKKWGELANKWGTFAEDIVAPNIRRLAEEEFGLEEVEDFLVGPQRRSRKDRKRWKEYDVLCAGRSRILVTEVKSSPKPEHIPAFLESLSKLGEFYPEYSGREQVGVFASFSLDDDLRTALAKTGLYGLAMGDETMEIVVRPERS